MNRLDGVPERDAAIAPGSRDRPGIQCMAVNLSGLATYVNRPEINVV